MKDMFYFLEEFWIRSLEGTMIDFEFETFFRDYEEYLWYKLASHGYFSLDDYINTNMYDYDSLEVPYWMYWSNPWVTVSKEAVKDAVLQLQMDSYREQLPAEYDDLMDLYERLTVRNYDPLNPNDLKMLTLLVDECIHAQHVTGFIIPDFDGVDLDVLRSDVEEKWRKENKPIHISVRQIRNDPAFI